MRLVVYGNLFSFSLQLQTAIGSGFRNSGIMCGKKGKIMLVRDQIMIGFFAPYMSFE